jgi:hypothetical protein
MEETEVNREDIIRMAREATKEAPREDWNSTAWVFGDETLERFAALVAKHTLANIDPRSFMSWQEGYEAGKQTEREACAMMCEEFELLHVAEAIRYRSKQ